MGLQTVQETREVDRFIASQQDQIIALSNRIAQLEAYEGPSPMAFAIIADQKAENTNGGGLTSGSWNTRTLNTIVSDVNGIVASLSSNRFTINSGKYIIRASAFGYNVARHKIRLRNITTGATAEVGTSEYAHPASMGNRSFLVHYADISVATTYELQHRVQSTNAGDGGGVESGTWGEIEVYAVVEITKIG